MKQESLGPLSGKTLDRVGVEEVQAIIQGDLTACVGPWESFSEDDRTQLEIVFRGAEPVNFFSSPSEWSQLQQRNGGQFSYVISAVNSRDKHSFFYLNCTGIAVVGTDRMSHHNVSVLTHQNPGFVLVRDKEGDFFSALRQSFLLLKERAEPGTISGLVFGGDHGDDNSVSRVNKSRSDDYVDLVGSIGSIYKEVFGTEVHIAVGPKYPEASEVDVLLDTQRRRLYITRPVHDGNIDESFPVNRVDEIKK